MENTDKKPALEFFHAQPNNWNCAQCILKTYQLRSQLSDEDIEAHAAEENSEGSIKRYDDLIAK